MNKLSENQKTIISLFIALAIGYFTFKISKIALILAPILFLGGVFYTIKTKNKNGIAHLLAGYIMGAEVYFRMAYVGLPWEFGKIAAIVLFLTAMVVDQKKRQTPYLILLFGLLLVPAYTLSIEYFSGFSEIKSKFLFNLSGPMLLVVSTAYFYKMPFNKMEFVNLSRWIVLGVITMSIFVHLRVGDYSMIQFSGSSNIRGSGGFSGNQVSLMFGLGVLVLGVNMILKNRIFVYLWLESILMAIFIFQALMTFSRGGIMGAVLGLVLGIMVYNFSNLETLLNFLVKHSLKLIVMIFLASGIFMYVDDMSGGMLSQRYFNVDKKGFKVKKSYGTGRGEIIEGDLILFEDSLYTGVGVGLSPIYRPLHQGYAAHVEYSRMLAEHGILGIFALVILFLYPFKHFISQMQRPENQMIAVSFIVFSLFSMTHSATRLGAITFFYGMGYLILKKKDKYETE